MLEVGREKCVEEIGYGKRWHIETTFGNLERKFGDTLPNQASYTNLKSLDIL